MGDDWVIFREELLLVKRLNQPHHLPGEEAKSLHHRSKTPLDGNAFFDGDRQLSEIWDLVPKKVQYVRISSQFLTLGRGVGDPLELV